MKVEGVEFMDANSGEGRWRSELHRTRTYGDGVKINKGRWSLREVPYSTGRTPPEKSTQ